MKSSILRAAALAALMLGIGVWPAAAWAQRTSTFEESVEYKFDSAISQDLTYERSATPAQCRDLCLANRQCRYWNWDDTLAGSTSAQRNCILLRGITGTQRGAHYGYRYVAGQVTNAPAGGGQPPNQAQPGSPPQQQHDANTCGQRVQTLNDGSRYEGIMCSGKMHGRGVLTYPSGTRYDGNWCNNKFCGRGLYTSPDGQRYEGEWRDGVINGHGIADFPNGARYEGQWVGGKPNGRGIYRLGGEVFSGNWANGCFSNAYQKAWVTVGPEDCGF